MILDKPLHLLQTIYHDDSQVLDAVVIDEATGKIATCSGSTIYIYKPYGEDDEILKVDLEGG